MHSDLHIQTNQDHRWPRPHTVKTTKLYSLPGMKPNNVGFLGDWKRRHGVPMTWRHKPGSTTPWRHDTLTSQRRVATTPWHHYTLTSQTLTVWRPDVTTPWRYDALTVRRPDVTIPDSTTPWRHKPWRYDALTVRRPDSTTPLQYDALTAHTLTVRRRDALTSQRPDVITPCGRGPWRNSIFGWHVIIYDVVIKSNQSRRRNAPDSMRKQSVVDNIKHDRPACIFPKGPAWWRLTARSAAIWRRITWTSL